MSTILINLRLKVNSMHPKKIEILKKIGQKKVAAVAGYSDGFFSQVIHDKYEHAIASQVKAIDLSIHANNLADELGSPTCFEPTDFNHKLHTHYNDVYPEAVFSVRSVVIKGGGYELHTAKDILDMHSADIKYATLYALIKDALQQPKMNSFLYNDHIYYYEGEKH